MSAEVSHIPTDLRAHGKVMWEAEVLSLCWDSLVPRSALAEPVAVD